MRHPSRTRWWMTIALILLLCQSIPAQAQSVSEIRVLQNQAVLTAGKKIAFSFQAESSALIDRATLIYGFSGHGCGSEGTRWGVYIAPAKQVQGGWAWDLAQGGGFPSGRELWWQWEIQDQSGHKLLTERQTLRLMDPGYRWQKIAQPPITLYWFEGSQAFAQKLLEIALKSLERLASEAGVESTGEITLLIYPSAEAMREQLVYAQDWAGGVALGEYDLVMMGISPADSTTWAEAVIPHEIAHLITENSFINCQAVRIPAWLNEGIATYAEGPVSWTRRDQVQAALRAGALPALKIYRHTFPGDGEKADLAYSQSVVVVTYLIDTYGVAKMHELVDRIRAGQTVDQALRVIYGLNTDELDQTWRASLGYGQAPEANFVTETPEPTRTPIPTLDLHPSIWTPAAPTSVVATRMVPSPSATPAVAATATPPAAQSTRVGAKEEVAAPAGAQEPEPFNPVVIGFFAGLLALTALLTVLIYRLIRPK